MAEGDHDLRTRLDKIMTSKFEASTWYVEELAQLHRTYRRQNRDEDENSGNGKRRAWCAGTAGHFPGGSFSDCSGHDWLRRLGQARLPVAKAVISSTREPKTLDWMRLVRQAKFLVSHGEVEWLLPVQDVPERYVVYGDSDW